MQTDKEELRTFYQMGEAICAHRLRPILDMPENQGKAIAIELDSGDYEVSPDKKQAITRLRERHPNKITYSRRIGPNPFSHVRGGRIGQK